VIRTAAEEYLRLRLEDPQYAAAHEAAARRVSMFDGVVSALDSRRVELGLTKAELANRADMPPAVVRRLFSQQHKNPTLTTLIAIADALDLAIQLQPGGPVGAIEEAVLIADRPGGAAQTRRRTA
jgi:transcriptional regulator with XRE-family HTH domain